jgi:hypothetical protein
VIENCEGKSVWRYRLLCGDLTVEEEEGLKDELGEGDLESDLSDEWTRALRVKGKWTRSIGSLCGVEEVEQTFVEEESW